MSMPDEPNAPEKEFVPSGVEGAVERFLQSEEAAKTAAKDQPPAKEPAGAEPKAEPTLPERKPALRLVNEKGELVLDRFKSDGKEIFLDDAEAVKTYLGFGYHHNVTGEDLKRREEALQKEMDAFKEADPMLGQIMTALQEGRVKIVEPGEVVPKKGAEPGAGESEDDDALLDPATAAIKKELRETRKALEGLQKGHKQLQDAYNMREVEKITTIMAKKIDEAKKQFKFADDDQVWTFMAEADANGKLKYTEEQAVKMSHESQVKKFQGWLDAEHPEFTQLSDSKRKEIIAEYLETKEKKEEAPVGKPSGIPAGAPGPKERVIKSLSDGVAQFFSEFGEGLEAAKKS